MPTFESVLPATRGVQAGRVYASLMPPRLLPRLVLSLPPVDAPPSPEEAEG